MVGLWVVHLPPVQGRLFEWARRHAEQQLGLAVGASSLSFNLFTRTVVLSDVSVRAGATADPFAEADRAVIFLGRDSFRGRVAISRVSLTRPRVTLIRYPDATTNLPVPRPGAGSGPSLHLGIVSAADLSVALDDRVARRSLALGPLDISVDTRGSAAAPGTFGPGLFKSRVGQVEIAGTIAGRLGFDGARVRVEDLTVETREGRVAIRGWTDVTGDTPLVSARVQASVDITQVARLARRDLLGFAGHLDGTVDVSGPLAAPSLELVVAGRNLTDPSFGPISVSGRASFSATRAVVHSARVSAAAGALELDGALDLARGPASTGTNSRLSLRWSDLHLDEIGRRFGPALPVQSGALASGTGAIDFDSRDLQARSWSRVRASASTTLQPLPGTPDDTLGVSGRADLQLDRGRWSIRHAIEAAHVRADLEGVVHGRLSERTGLRSTLTGRTRLRVEDLRNLPSVLQSAGIALPPGAGDDAEGSMLVTVNLGGTLESPRAQIDVEARDLRTRLLSGPVALDAHLALDTDGINAQRLRATSGATSLDASGRHAWRGPLDVRVDLNFGDLAAAGIQFQLPVDISGSARLEGTVSGTLLHGIPRGHAVLALSARDLAVEQVPIGALTAMGTLPLESGGLTVVNATAPDVGIHARAEIVNEIGYPLSGDITVDHGDIAALIPPQYREQVGELSGTLSATARGSGRLLEPAGIRGRVHLRRLDVTARGTRLLLASPGSITVAEDGVEVGNLALHIGERTRVTAGGRLGIAAVPDPLRLHVAGPVPELIAIGARLGGATPILVTGEGTATLDLTVTGTLGRPLPAGSLVIRASSLHSGTVPPVTSLAADAVIDPTGITLQSLSAVWQDAELRARGTLPWRVVLSSLHTPPASGGQSPRLAAWLNALPSDPNRATLSLGAEHVTQALLKDVIAGERLQNIRGRFSLTADVETDHLSLERVEATARLDQASLTLAGVPFVQTVPTRLRMQNGRVTLEEFRWSAEGNAILASGEVNLTDARPSINASVSGSVDLRVVAAFVDGVASGGTARAELTFTGPIDEPQIVGDVTVSDGELLVDNPRLVASDLAGTVRIDADRRMSVSLAGLVNTGPATLEGTLHLADGSAALGTLRLIGRGVALEYPSGLQTESNAHLEIAFDAAGSTLSGRVDVLDGTYREALVLSRELLRLSSVSGIARTAPPSGWLSRMRMNVTVATTNDVQINNNYGRLDIGATLRLVGTPLSPGVLGRVEAADGGEIYLGGNTYQVERLTIDLNDPRVITPDVNFSAVTRIGDLPIGIELRCPGTGTCERTVTSLIAGVDNAEAEARLFGTEGGAASAGESLARLLSGELLGVVGRSVGLDSIRLEQAAERRDIFDDPTLVAGDVDPAARLTLAKRLGSDVELVYSQNLADNGFTWITSYFGPYGLSGRLLILDDQSRSYEFRHELLGGDHAVRRLRPPGPRVAAVRISGSPGVPESELRRQLRLGEGDHFTFGAWQRDRDQLQRFYHERGRLEARIRARRVTTGPGDTPGSPADGQVVLEYEITPGPATQLTITGATLPNTVRSRIVERWTSALFDGFVERDARTIVRDHLYREGYLHTTVTATIARDAARETKTLHIDVVPGNVVPGELEVTGHADLSTAQLLAVIAVADTRAAWLDPPSIERLLEDHYRSQGYLAADVSVGAPETRGDASVVTISIVEGPPYSIGEVVLRGLPAEAASSEALGFSSAERYRPAAVSQGLDRLRTVLRRAAYRDARVAAETTVDASDARVHVAVKVTPGPRSILHDVVVEGGDPAKPQLARAIVLEPGRPLDPADIRETRKRLYDLDVYRSVEIDVQPADAARPVAPATGSVTEPVVARITLLERPRYRFRYGLAFTEEDVGPDERDRRLGIAADLENRNLFGRGASAGLALRLRRDQQVARVIVGARRLFGLPIRSTVFVERAREHLNPDAAFPITSDITGLTAEQSYQVRRGIELRYGYGSERNHTFIDTDESDPFDLTVRIARFTTSGLIDRRDDPFDPGRGWFAASSLELSNHGLGSDLRFFKDFTQYAHFVPIGRTVLASKARLGLARTFGEEVLIPSERFFAGGANTVRGYREDDLGARSVFDDAEGGSAMLILNGELRFPVYRWLKGVGFIDLGNVYPSVSDVSLTDLQIGVGAGARFDTPVGLIRFDVGVPANRRSFDPRWRIHFGLGHAF